MAITVVWTPEAEETFDEIIRYLEVEFGDAVVRNFLRRVAEVISTVSQFPEIFQSAGTKNVRKGFIARQTSLYYSVKGDRIELISFWNNKRNPENLKW